VPTVNRTPTSYLLYRPRLARQVRRVLPIPP
jgi:hypothetical protein